MRKPTTPTVVRPRAKKGEGAQLREELLVAAESLMFKYQDFDSLSIQAVCDLVGCTPPAIYRHFADKNALVYEVCTRIFELFSDFVMTEIGDVTDIGERLHRRGRAYVEFGLANPEAYRLLFMHRADSLPKPAGHEIDVEKMVGFSQLLEDVRTAVDTGYFEGDALLVACQIWMGFHGVTSLLISKPRFPWPDDPEFRVSATAAVIAGHRRC